MPTDEYQRLRRKIDRTIEKVTEYPPTDAGRQYVRYLMSMRAGMTQVRYLDRPKTYHDHQIALETVNCFPLNPINCKTLLRVSPSELERLVRMFGDHDAFRSRGRKPQAPAKLQIAVCLARLGSGNSVDTIQRIFDLPSRFSSSE